MLTSCGERRTDECSSSGDPCLIRPTRGRDRWRGEASRPPARPCRAGRVRVDGGTDCKNYVGIDRRHGLIHTWAATEAARQDGAQLPGLVSKANTATDVWADTAYRSKGNGTHLADSGFRSRIHRRKPLGRPVARNVARANGWKSKVRAAVEHVFVRQKGPMGLVVRTVGLARAAVTIGWPTSYTT